MSYEDDDIDDEDAELRRQYLDGRTPAQAREQTLREIAIPWARTQFKNHPERRSILLGVSQYWADEANDAVHVDEVFSTQETPRWPHYCYTQWDELGPRPEGYGDTCSSCCRYQGDEDDDKDYWANHLQWHDNGDAIPAFEMFCHEEGSQDYDSNHNAMPYAILRRGEGEVIDVEIVGRVIRGWLDHEDEWVTPPMHDERLDALYRQVYLHVEDDGPRHVLADELLHRGDPLGEYLSLALQAAPTVEMRARAEQLLSVHRRRWLGGLARVVPDGAAEFVRGFPTRVAAHYDEAGFNNAFAAAEWGTVESLVLLPGCFAGGLPIAPNLRELGPLGSQQLIELSEQPMARLEALELQLEAEDTIDLLSMLELPSLRALALSGGFAVPRVLSRLARMSSPIEAIELRTLEAAEIAQWLETRGRPRRLSFCRAQYGWPSGFRLLSDAEDGGTTLQVSLVALDREADARRLGELIALLPRSLVERVVLQSSRLWSPYPHEVAQLRELGGREVVVR